MRKAEVRARLLAGGGALLIFALLIIFNFVGRSFDKRFEENGGETYGQVICIDRDSRSPRVCYSFSVNDTVYVNSREDGLPDGMDVKVGDFGVVHYIKDDPEASRFLYHESYLNKTREQLGLGPDDPVAHVGSCTCSN